MSLRDRLNRRVTNSKRRRSARLSRNWVFDDSQLGFWNESHLDLFNDPRAQYFNDSQPSLFNDSTTRLFNSPQARLADDFNTQGCIHCPHCQVRFGNNSRSRLLDDSRYSLVSAPTFQSVEFDETVFPQPRPEFPTKVEVQVVEKPPPYDFPDGGVKAWTVAAGTALALFCTMGMMNSFGIFQEYYSTHQLADKSPSEISWIGALQIFFLFASTLFGGPLFDRYGAKVIRPAILLFVISFMLTSVCKEYWHFIICHGIINGIASGMTMSPAMAVVPQYFQKKRGAAMGLTVAGSSVGGVIMPIMLTKMLYSPLGFGWTLRIMGFVFLALLSVSAVAIKPRLPPRKTGFILLSAFKNPVYCLIVASCSLALLGAFVPIFYLPAYAAQYGMSPQMANYLISILNGASIFGRILPGILSDKFGRLNLLITTMLGTGILVLCWPQAQTSASIIVFAALFGFVSGGVVSGMNANFASCASRPSDFGTFLGMGMFVVSFACLISPPINGAFIDHYHSFDQAAYFSGVLTVLGGILAIIPKFLQPGGFSLKS